MSVDDMMKNLKRKSQEVREQENPLGELVTRADGSTALKVKSRKRRSDQPKSKSKVEEKSQRKKVIILSSVVVLFLLIGIGYGFVAGYYNSGGFEKKVIASLKSSSNADVEVQALDVGLSESRLASLSLDWGRGASVIKSIKAQEVSADTGSIGLLTSGWSGKEVNASSVDMYLDYAKDFPSKVAKEEPEFDYSIFLCNEVNIHIGDSGKWRLNETSASYKINDAGQSQIDLYNGTLVTPLNVDYKLFTGVVTLEKESMDLSLKLASNETDGSVLLEGAVGYTKGEMIDLKTTFQDVPIEDWLNAKLKRFLGGKMTYATGALSMNLGDEESIKLSLDAESKGVYIGSFPFVRTLSLALKDDYFVKPIFEDGATFKLKQSSAATQITEISFLQESHMKLTGQFQLADDGRLSGTLRLGIPVVRMNAVDNKVVKAVFNEDDGLFFWATVNISGSVSTPLDDLDEQLEKARKSSILQLSTDVE